MKNFKVNADYESVLFFNKEAPKVINESLEFLFFFLEKNPLLSQKTYSESYFEYVESITNYRPQIVRSGEVVNWWGDLKNIPLEKRLNSKEVVLQFNKDSKIISSLSELKDLGVGDYLAKPPFGMSGQNFSIFNSGSQEKLSPLLKKTGKLLVEPLFKRIKDFSHYVINESLDIAYENIVDQNFQYKGSLFRNRSNPNLLSLSFYSDLDMEVWEKFQKEFSNIKSFCQDIGIQSGYSVDSFVYLDHKRLMIRTISEINYRKTMGLVTWLLSEKFGGNNNWSLLVLAKPSGDHTHEKTLERIKSIAWNKESGEGCMLLSPGDTRFDIFFLSASSEDKGKMLFKELKNLLLDGQLTIDI